MSPPPLGQRVNTQISRFWRQQWTTQILYCAKQWKTAGVSHFAYMRSQCGNKFESHKYKTCWPFIWARIYVRQHSFLKSSIQGCFSLYFFLCMCYVMLCCVCIQLTCALLFNQVCDFLKKIHENCLNTVTAASVIAHLFMFHLCDHTLFS